MGWIDFGELSEKTGLAGSKPPLLRRCIQPPGCVPATTKNTMSMESASQLIKTY